MVKEQTSVGIPLPRGATNMPVKQPFQCTLRKGSPFAFVRYSGLSMHVDSLNNAACLAEINPPKSHIFMLYRRQTRAWPDRTVR